MKKFEIPKYYRSPIISVVKAKRKEADPRKRDFSPTHLDFGTVKFLIARHFGFCYGVENAIEIAYRTIDENPDKRIFLLSQMIHNPDVNLDLQKNGVQFIQDTSGKQLISWDELKRDDIVIIPAFGTTLEIISRLEKIGLDIEKYDTTCPFVEKVWNRSEKLGTDNHTVIIHGKPGHEETRATFSHSRKNGHAVIVRDLQEAKVLGSFILGKIDPETFMAFFDERFTENFNPDLHLEKIGVVNQTTMLASETQEITNYLRTVMVEKFGENALKKHLADTRDTLCYATNDNQTATIGLMQEVADFALVVGGYNSSNTTHLVELLESKMKTYFIKSESEIHSISEISSFDIHEHELQRMDFKLKMDSPTIAITSGASCPDSVVDRVIQRILELKEVNVSIETIIEKLK